MTHSNRLIAGIACCALLLGSACAMAQDWPQWRGPNRDGKATGFQAPQEWPKQLSQKWKVTVGTGDSTPALVGDKLYVFARQGGDEVIMCLNAADGKEAWREKYAARAVTGAAARQHPGPRSSPCVADGKVVTLGVGGVVSCVDAASGKLAWRNSDYKDVPKFFTAMSPIIVDGMAILHLGNENQGAVVAFDLASGNEKWKWTGAGPGYSSPVIMTADGVKQLVEMTAKSVVGLNLADGKLLWEIPFPVQGMAYNAATPIIDGQTVIYTGQGRGTKSAKIAKSGDAFLAKEQWSNPLAPQFNTPVLKDGFLYGLASNGDLFCIDAKDGQTAWTNSARRGGFGSIVDVGTALVILPQNGELSVFKPEVKMYTEITKYKVADTQTYAHPVMSGKRIFVKDQDSLILWTLE